jgi:hypothetical protein
MAVVFDLDKGIISIHAVSPPAKPVEGVSAGEDEETAVPQREGALAAATNVPSEAAGEGLPAEMERKLDKVRIDSLQLEGKEEQKQGSCTVMYSNNGTCAPYRLRLADEEGGVVTVDVDALSSARTENTK